MKRAFLLLFSLVLNFSSFAQALSSTDIYLGLQRLKTVGNVMYIAAHPDDENTLLITYLAKEKKVRTAYYAMTRGDGGQNLIGSEQDEYVGLIRTHELLEARKIDGGEQYFSRAVDFGFSKSTDEALLLWGKEKILEDLVYRIRKFQPDVMINRFPPDERAGHGHHSASAVLSKEAFDAAGDPQRFPEQLKEVQVWQPTRLVWNTFGRGFTNTAPDGESYVGIALGEYNPLLGEAYTELAARARSKHRSQGFGSSPSRGERSDYLVHVKGVPAKKDVFDGIDLSWNRVPGGSTIDAMLEGIVKRYDFLKPQNSVADLLKVYSAIKNLPESVYKADKLEECRALIYACAGLYLEVNTAAPAVSPGQGLKLFSTAVNRSSHPVEIKGVKLTGVIEKDSVYSVVLENNKSREWAWDLILPKDAPITQPYWMLDAKEIGKYVVSDEKFRNSPMAPDALYAEFNVYILGVEVPYKHPVKYKYTEPSRGEIYKYFEVRPEIMLNFEQNVQVFTENKPKVVGVIVKNNLNANKAQIGLELPQGWTAQPAQVEVEFTEKDQEKPVYFTVTPGKGEAKIQAVALNERGTYRRAFRHIYYEHIPELNTYPLAQARAINLDIKTGKKQIAYIMGAGDEVAQSLGQIGYEVTFLDENSIKGDLSRFPAIVIGVRAYNTKDWLANAQKLLLEYVKNGGNLVVQYQTQAFYGKIKTNELGPYPMNIGRGRVTDEHAAVKIINPNDPIMSYPNKIGPDDFKGWVQERGLYFAQEWSDKYKTVLSMKDKGETEQEGALLYAQYGKGHFVFTGLSLFRQLPAGVPGAYRLLANMISLQ
jgi:LmbE family N-acetylglucosaminyl deacetylase